MLFRGCDRLLLGQRGGVAERAVQRQSWRIFVHPEAYRDGYRLPLRLSFRYVFTAETFAVSQCR